MEVIEALFRSFAQVLILAGSVLVLAGVVLWLGGRSGLGHLPGDWTFGRGGTKVYFPLATSLLLSAVLTLVLNLLVRR